VLILQELEIGVEKVPLGQDDNRELTSSSALISLARTSRSVHIALSSSFTKGNGPHLRPRL
jgi:hypothetical protein